MSTKSREKKQAKSVNVASEATINRTLAIGILAVTALLAGGVFFFTRVGFGDSVKSKPTIEYTAGAGAGMGASAVQAVANSPLTIKVRIPGLDGTPNTMLGDVVLNMLDEAGQPAVFGGKSGPQPMQATTDIEVWQYNGSVPSKPGTYRAEVETVPFAKGHPTQTLDLREPSLPVVADTMPPIRSGYVLAREGDLWLLSGDGTQERRLTFYAPPTASENADEPAWSPDGKTIAYAYSPPVKGSEIQHSEIWGIGLDSANAHQLVSGFDTESLSAPSWSQDSKYLYFTVETDSTDASGGQILLYRTDRVEVATGTRTQAAANAEMVSSGGPGDEIVYLENIPMQEGGPPSSGQRIAIAQPEGSQKRVVVSENEYPSLYAPSVSPDGKWVVFAAVNENSTPQPTGFDPFKWLTLEPDVAQAHGIPWELYLVPAAGGTPAQITHLSDDQPFPVWRDNATLSFMGIKGLYTLSIDAQGKPTGNPQKIGEGVQHGRLSWHGQ